MPEVRDWTGTRPDVTVAPGRVLTVNAGSSSLKLRVLDDGGPWSARATRGSIGDRQASCASELEAFLADAPSRSTLSATGSSTAARSSRGPTVLDAERARTSLERLADLAPLHNPPAVRGDASARRQLRPELPTVACFDTAFHATMPAAASTYAIPAAWAERWPLRRFGFHGLSHAYASRAPRSCSVGRSPSCALVTAHLGAGASLAAVGGGRSVDTTMGFTPLEGLVMATRSGSVDPGLLLWVQRHGEIGAEEMERALEHEAGLLGLSGRSGDMREVLAGAGEGDERCRLAFDVYVHRLVAGVAAMAAAMGGLDALVFTGGVGENSARVRGETCERLQFLGVELDREANENGAGDRSIAAPGASVEVLVIAAREELEIARQVWGLLGTKRPGLHKAD